MRGWISQPTHHGWRMRSACTGGFYGMAHIKDFLLFALHVATVLGTLAAAWGAVYLFASGEILAGCCGVLAFIGCGGPASATAPI